jgi:superfamily II DNA or RNA helicase
MVTIIVGNTKCKIIGLRDDKVIDELEEHMSYSIQGFQFMKWGTAWDGKQRLFTKNHYFPVGLLLAAEKILKKNNVTYDIQDNRDKPVYGEPLTLSPTSGFEVRDYQLDIVNKAWKHGGGIIRLATGGGKSLGLTLIMGRFNIRTVIYVIGIELLYQMKETVERAYPNLKVGMVGDGHCDVQQVTIATIWSAASAFGSKIQILDSDLTPDKEDKKLNKEKVMDMVQKAEMIIIDECQYAASETIQFLHKNSLSARHRFLFSGTPWRDSGDDILIESVGGPKIFDLNASKLIDMGWLIPPKIYFVDVPMQRGVGRTYQQVYNTFIVNNDERNDLIIKSTIKLVSQGRKVLILVTKVSHGKHLLSLLKDSLRVSSLDGSNKTSDRLAAITAMKAGELDVLIASKIFDQGIDIPDLDALVLAGSGKSSARALQRIGRVIRKGKSKKDAVVVDFLDNCKYLRDHSLIRKKIYETEPGFKIVVQKKEKDKK